MNFSVLWLFLMVPVVGLQCLFMVFPDHTHLLFWLGNMSINENVELPVDCETVTTYSDILFLKIR